MNTDIIKLNIHSAKPNFFLSSFFTYCMHKHRRIWYMTSSMLLQLNDLNNYFWTNKSYQNIYQENLFWLLKSQKSYTAANNYISKLGETVFQITYINVPSQSGTHYQTFINISFRTCKSDKHKTHSQLQSSKHISWDRWINTISITFWKQMD